MAYPLTANLNGVTYVVDSSRFVSGGVNHMKVYDLISGIANAVAPNVVTVSCAANATVNLVSVFNTIRTTSDGTIANAIFNLPATANDGQLCVFVTTGAVSNVTGTVNLSIPNVTSTAAGTRITRRYDKASGLWLAA